MMFELHDKVALVTGAAKGIGLAYVKELLQNGVKGVALIDTDVTNGQNAVDQIVSEFGKGKAIFINADVSDATQLRESFETTVKSFSQLDIVVNNAGIVHERHWERCVAVNLGAIISGTILAVEEYLPKYRSGSEGVVINIASLAGLMPFEGIPTYTATKSGAVGFSRAIGGDVHYQRTKVRVVAICPGLVDTTIVNISKEQLPEAYSSLLQDSLKILVAVKPEVVAKHGMNIIKESPTGSAWLIMNGRCTQVEFTNYFD